MIWFTSDLHFDHTRILQKHPTRGASIEEMHERIISNWNAVVAHRDEVWVLGDFAWRASMAEDRFRALRGQKHLVVGNHDAGATRRLPWKSVRELHRWRHHGLRAVLCHYPILSWPGAHRGAWMLHGHTHGLLQEPEPTTRLDVGIDTHPEFRPYSLDEIIASMADRSYFAVDGHTPG